MDYANLVHATVMLKSRIWQVSPANLGRDKDNPQAYKVLRST